MKIQLLLVIMALSVSFGMAKTNECVTRGGICRASGGKNGCLRLQGKCDNDQVCCQKDSSLKKRKCRQKRSCTKQGGDCIATEESCLKITSDDLCKGASCKCCLGNNPSCTVTPGCQLRGGFCFKNSGKDLCADGTIISGECEGAKCACCIPKTGSCECGVANDVRIIGGQEISPPNRYPWLVGMLRPTVYNNEFFCGGSIINQNYVLTAAHCLLGDDDLPLPAKEFQVGIANHNFNSEDDDIEGVTRAVDVKSYIIHEDYVPQDLNDNNNDIALLLLKESLNLTSQVRPVCLPSDPNRKYEGETGTVIGWGDTKNGKGAYPDAAREVDVPIRDCKRKKIAGSLITPQMMCAGKKKSKNNGAKGACFGDSGGPLFVREDGKYTQVGIVSFGGSCLKPGVFVRVTEFLTWISDNTPDETYCQ
ncbi:LOW QUALITY PROTEIN: venom protease-like [Penaeus monodon]|uniref:LOW QUALITY PROTEIN: venom protease-like n=1 Tax=Penaeus monodon TaxID=6687 RepID=UPI0018A6DAEB|nr:LOW QUALITY PROTEIN: venom protease-like [Penaeus monodon]